METVNKLEELMASWYKDAPHLPKEGTRWLAENAWWLTLIGVVLGALGVVGLLSATLLAGALLTGFGGPVGAAIGGIALFAALIGIAFSVACLVLGALAITPLKTKQKKGWTLLFILMLLNVLAQVAGFLFSYNFFGLIWSLLFTAIGGYFLFEIREYYGARSTVKLKTRTAAKKA